MRLPSVRNPRSFWDLFAVVVAYVALEYVVLRATGSHLVEQELVVVAVLVAAWVLWAVFRILGDVE